MATIVTRTGKGSALTFTEADDNFINLNNDGIANSSAISTLQTDKLDKAGGTVTGTLNVNGNLTLGSKLIGSSSNNSQSGAGITISGSTSEIIRLTSASLVSVSGIDSGVSGQKNILVNKTGVNVSILNNSSFALSLNRIFTGNGSDVTLPPDASISIIYDGSSSRWNVVGGTGSGSGSAGINYIVNTDASSGTVGWTTYADAAGAQPVDGSGGSPQPGLWVSSSTTPLRGSADFNLVKTGTTSYQGNGVAYDVTIDNADLARVLTVSFDYEVVSGTYATGDLTVYLIQDPTGTPVVIQPAGFQVVAATVGTKMTQIATFQTDVAQKSYRLCFHVATTSIQDYTLALDNIVLGPTQKVYGAPVTDWQSYTPTIGSYTGSVTNATATAKYRRVGDSIEGEATITFSGASAAFANPNITLPSGLTGDTSKIPADDTDRGIGTISCLDAGSLAYGPWYASYDSTINKISAKYSPVVNATSASITEPVRGSGILNNFPFTFGANDRIFISFKLPILGWSSNVEVSSSTDTRVVTASYVNNGGKSIPNNTQTTIDTNWLKLTDTHNAFSNGVFTCPVAGNYVVGARFLLNSAANAANSLFNITAVQAGSTTTTINIGTYTALAASTYYVGTSGAGQVFSCQAGDTLTIQCYQTLTAGGRTLHTDSAYNSVSISRLSGPSVIAASETVSARYNNTSGQSGLTNNAYTTITGWTKTFDTHGFFNLSTGIATIPVSGKYLVQGQFLLTSASTTLNTEADLAIQQAGSASGTYLIGSTFPSVTGTYGVSGQGSNIIQCIAGDTLTIQIYQNTGISRALNTNGNYTWVSFTRIGN
jgi:hypothetical protein